MTDSEYFDEDDNFISKSQLKREMHSLQEIGRKLLALTPEKQQKIPMSDQLASALEEGRRIKQREATRRHLQYIGKLMRKEPNIDAITHALDLMDASSDAYAQKFHYLERWRDRLIAEGREAVTELVKEMPNADAQHLNQLIRNAQKEKMLEKAPGSSRKIFRYLKDLAENP